MKKLRRKRGRPRGTGKLLVDSGYSIRENQELAAYGNLTRSRAAWYANFLYDVVYPGENPISASMPTEKLEAIQQSHAHRFGEEALRRLKAGDAQFFSDFAELVKLQCSGRFPVDLYRSLLIGFAAYPGETGVLRLIDEIQGYLRKEGIRKSKRALRRDLDHLGIRYAHGKPGRKPAPRPARKRPRQISMRALKQSVNAGSERFRSSRPEMMARRKSGHIG